MLSLRSANLAGSAGVNIVEPQDKPKGVLDADSMQRKYENNTFPKHEANGVTIIHAHLADVELLMPKLHHADYYTEPTIQELAAKEREEPGFCRRVKDFLVGRHDHGYIRFLGETDVYGLDLESIVQFNSCEVKLYKDKSKRNTTGQGLNKVAEVTLLNIKCIDKRTGDRYMDGPRVIQYRDMLMKAAESQGAEFVSYDPVKGEWKFRLEAFQ